MSFVWVPGSPPPVIEEHSLAKLSVLRNYVSDYIDRLCEGPRRDVFKLDLIYHFAPYEPSAMKRLMGRYATREDEVDRMLRAGLFVDLYRVVRDGIRAGVESYSIKKLEAFYEYERSVDLYDANDSLYRVESALELADAPGITDEDKRAVEGYNERRQRFQDVAERIERAADRNDRSEEQQARWVLANVLDWHWREDKVDYWEHYRMAKLPVDDLADERQAVANLAFVERVGGTDRAPIHRYRYEDQETDLRGSASLGLVVKVKETFVSSGDSGVATTTFSDWGAENIITAPISPPSATPTPTPPVIPGSDSASPVSAQQAFEDACADATPVSHVDLTTEGIATYNSDPYTWRRVIRVAPNAEHHLTTAPDSNEQAEMIIVESPGDGTRSDGGGGSVTLYTRSADDAGVWGNWSIENANIPASGTGRSSSGSEHFCGMETSRFTSFEYVGTETVDGMDTKHFRASRTPAGAPNGDYQWVDYWIDLNGVPIKVTESYSVAGDQMETTTTYSGWGETNTITVPENPTTSD